ncbi:type IV pilus assembly protein PilM [Motiliproteus sp. MSK22-1]|uniref:type IV pilus assembly protein PilM n=1 Tax=Motiliproteus sp. MSK22-1 TaxID=1897630 RepID=UPI00097793C8|nr:type IV pilus assembly protein PilM [Motiliproteus sp. MSK22-1]OMH28054.1 pilus assembly protein PilM [Motiliproteus sp. MSK22-1]
MTNLFKTKSKPLLGVDIGSSFVKVLGLSQLSKGYKIDSYAVVHLPEGAVIDNNVQEVPIVAEALKKGVRISGSRNKMAITSVPASVVIVKDLEFSRSFTEDELEEQIKVEADQFIPYPLDEVAIDFQIRGQSATDPEINDVLLVACRQDSVQSREDSVNGAGLQCDVIDIDTYALERTFPLLSESHDLEGKTVGLIDIGASSMSLYVLEEGKVVYSREQVFGGNDLTHNLSQVADMSADEVERAKKEGSLPEDLVRGYVEPFKQTAAQQISRSLQFFYSSGTHAELDILLLSGGVSALSDLDKTVEQELGINTQVANPFSGMKLGSKVNRTKFEADSSSLLLACGLALRSFEG